MVRHYTEKELKEALSRLTVVTDTRERKCDHVLSFLDRHQIPHVSRKLDCGDYSAMLGQYTLEYHVAVERKASLDELCGNFTAERERFEREFLRAKAAGVKMFLLIENASWTDVFSHNYASRLEPKALAASLLAWQAKYNVTLLFAQPQESGRLIYGILYYWLRETLLKGGGI